MQRVKNVIKAMCELYDRKMSDATIVMFMSDLSGYTENQLLQALKTCRSELKFFPSIFEIKERIQDGHLTPNEAWAAIPKGEDDSVCWTKEMRDAFFAGAELLLNEGDKIGAKFAFIESYKKILAKAREERKPAVYNVSFGYDKGKREQILQQALDRKLLTQHDVKRLMPDKVEELPDNVRKLISGVVKDMEDVDGS